MDVNINILPDYQKEKIEKEQKDRLVVKIFVSVILALIIVNVILVLMYFVLNIEYQAGKKSSDSFNQNNIDKEIGLEKIFQEADKQVLALSKISQNSSDWAKVLTRIAVLTPDGVKISQISANGTNLKISGFSKTRDDFLVFQDNLASDGLQFPVDISNLVSADNLNFDLDMEIPKEYLMRK
ncbi:MAG: PilN domain-containing protein [Candidatus Moranbacteria bacterium]|nr:PilN domain-containing protein [Candidatus Moranbacteria bacterium]